jgi:O-acetyl-ADP-ribose deacetylase (regulator of RNase III)
MRSLSCDERVLRQEVFAFAGPELERECEESSRCRTGQATATSAGNLPCRYVRLVLCGRKIRFCYV